MGMGNGQRRVEVRTLGPATIASPLARTLTLGDGSPKFVPEGCFIRPQAELPCEAETDDDLLFEKAGARSRIFFDPARTRAAIVTCGGLSPGLNNVIRSVFLELHMNYGVPDVLGIRYGYQGLSPQSSEPPLRLTMDLVEDIHEEGGTLLGSSRGAVEPQVMVDFLVAQGIDILFCVGGDGTQRGAHAIAEEIARRGLKIAVVGIPKTIDNDIEFCDRTFGFTTAVAAAQQVLSCAHVEARGARNGIGLIKLMGRDAGFIAATATVASQEVNFALIPELPFALEGERGFLETLRRRMLARQHAVIAVAEGAGQHLFANSAAGTDASGNRRYQDIGLFLKQRILEFFAERGPKVELKYIDPSYIIRSVPANCEDDILCDQFARRAVHAAMAGKTDLVVCLRQSSFVHVPLPLIGNRKRQVNLEGELWASVLACTGQPRTFPAA